MQTLILKILITEFIIGAVFSYNKPGLFLYYLGGAIVNIGVLIGQK